MLRVLHTHAILLRQNPDISKRKCRLRYPDQIDPVYREIHKLWNDNIDAARGKTNVEGSGSVEECAGNGDIEEDASSTEHGRNV